MDVNLSPLLMLLFEYLAVPILMVLIAIVVAFGMRFYKRLGLGNDDIVRGYLQDAMRMGVDYALTKAKVKLGQPVTVTIRNQVIADAAAYVINAAPGAVRHFGITPDGVMERIIARLPDTLRDEVDQSRPAEGWQSLPGSDGPQPAAP